MAYAGVREFLEVLEREGDLARVKVEVETAYEIGAICRRVLDHRGPALLFERPAGFDIPVAVNLFATLRRYCLALDVEPKDLHREWLRRIATPVPPVVVSDGPCKERILHGEDVDLTALPNPIWNERDGGPYITLPTHISRDPETGIRNVSMYRAQVHDRASVGAEVGPYRHLWLHAEKAFARGERHPVAIALGVDPTITIAATSPFPFGVDELAMAGALRGAPVEVVRCETVPLEVPATAEIVLEGEILPGERRAEGLFGEFTGYYGLVVERPVIHIRCITRRAAPIYVASYEGRPPQETCLLQGIPIEVEILRQVPLPGIRGVHVTEGGCGGFNAIVSVTKTFEGYGKMVGLNILSSWAGRLVKTLIVVDDDIDIRDWTSVEWALATRVQPHRDVEILTAMTGSTLDPSLPVEERRTGHSRTSKMLIDATRYDAATFEVVCRPHPEVAARVAREWATYGIP